MNSVVIVAGGNGLRFGGDMPKQFYKLNGKEILSYSVSTFYKHPQIDEVVIVCHPYWVDHVKSKYPECIVTMGGERRQDSSLNGIMTTSHKADIVLIHDAARPFVSEAIITDCLAVLETCDGSAPILDSPDSLIEWDGKSTIKINRSDIKIVQTPQCFRINVIKELYKTSIDSSDEISLALKSDKNYTIKLISGSEKNIKITTKSDLDLTKILLKKYES